MKLCSSPSRLQVGAIRRATHGILARVRLKRREVEEKSRKVEDLQRIIREFDQMAADLDRQIQIEEDRTGVRDRSALFLFDVCPGCSAAPRQPPAVDGGAARKAAAAVRERDDTMEQFSRACQQAEGRGDDPRGSRRDRPFGITTLR